MPELELTPALWGAGCKPALSEQTVWFRVDVLEGAAKLCFKIEGESSAQDKIALIVLEFEGEPPVESLNASGVFRSERYGWFAYVAAESLGRLTRLDLPFGEQWRVARVGFAKWAAGGRLELAYVEIVPPLPDELAEALEKLGPLKVMLSIDVEALPGRSRERPVETLIWGDVPDAPRDMGVGLMMDLFALHQAPATFFLDYAECASHGDDQIFKVARSIDERGFDVQLHVHAEILSRTWLWPVLPVVPHLEALSADYNRAAMGYCVSKYRQSVGRRPTAFRAGGFKFNESTLQACADLGIKLTSNVRVDQRKRPLPEGVARRGAHFWWPNRLLELPVTVVPDPIWQLDGLEFWRRLTGASDSPDPAAAVIVMHSWTFLHRDEDGFHHFKDMQAYRALSQFLALAPDNVSFIDSRDVLNAPEAAPPESEVSECPTPPTSSPLADSAAPPSKLMAWIRRVAPAGPARSASPSLATER